MTELQSSNKTDEGGGEDEEVVAGLVLAGDFNSTPLSAVYHLLSTCVFSLVCPPPFCIIHDTHIHTSLFSLPSHPSPSPCTHTPHQPNTQKKTAASSTPAASTATGWRAKGAGSCSVQAPTGI